IAAIFVLFALAWLGSDWATRFQYVVMALIATALTAFAVGAAAQWDAGRLLANAGPPAGAEPFWIAFAVFFPAVTGFTQGISMSGDLESPSRSLPRGTFAAVGLSSTIYIAAAFLFAGAASSAELAFDMQSMRRLAAFGPLV